MSRDLPNPCEERLGTSRDLPKRSIVANFDMNLRLEPLTIAIFDINPRLRTLFTTLGEVPGHLRALKRHHARSAQCVRTAKGWAVERLPGHCAEEVDEGLRDGPGEVRVG